MDVEATVRAILIDPIARTFREVRHNGDYKQIYEYLSDKDNGLDVTDFNSVMIDRRNIVWVDGEGLLKNPRYFFVWRGYHQPLAGRGLVLGTNEQGETIGTTWSMNMVRDHVRFTQLSVQDMVQSDQKPMHAASTTLRR